jgi:hypothetical protein
MKALCHRTGLSNALKVRSPIMGDARHEIDSHKNFGDPSWRIRTHMLFNIDARTVQADILILDGNPHRSDNAQAIAHCYKISRRETLSPSVIVDRRISDNPDLTGIVSRHASKLTLIYDMIWDHMISDSGLRTAEF